MKLSSKKVVRLAVLPLLVLPVLVHAPRAEAKPVKSSVALAPVNEAWAGKRVLLLLPLRTSPTWQGNPEFTRMFLPQAQAALRDALNRTGKFSLLEVRRFNPVLMRAVQDGATTTDDLNTLLEQPTVPNASVFLSKTSFNRAPMQSFSTPATIGSFVLESVEQLATELRVKITGRMYEPGSTTAMRALSATVSVPIAPTLNSARTPAITAVSVGFDRVLNEFTRYPTERELPVVPAVPVVTTAPVTVETTTVTTTSGVVLPGTPITGASSRPLTPDGRASTATTTATSSTLTTVVPATGLVSVPGITVEVETPPAEVFPAAPAPSSSGGGDEETPEAVVEEEGVSTETEVSDVTVDTESDVVSEEEVVPDTETATDTVTDDTTTESSDNTDVPDEASTDDTDEMVSETAATGAASPSSPVIEISDDTIAPEDVLSGEQVTTSIRSRVRERIPGEQPAFER